MSRININQISITPNVPLGRIGCTIEEQLDCIDYGRIFSNTPFENYAKAIFLKLATTKEVSERKEFMDFVKSEFVNYVCIFRKYEKNKKVDKADSITKKLIKYGVFNEQLSSKYNLENFGNVLECLVGFALYELKIQSYREVKIKYPIDCQPYDPDGQKYDVIGTLDFSNFIWIECKKPKYISENPLNNILSISNLKKFLKRVNMLCPALSVYLVDTNEDYNELLEKRIRQIYEEERIEIFNGSPLIYDSSIDGLNNIMGKIANTYFLRINYRSNKDFYQGLKKALQQVLYDSREMRI